MKNLIIGITLFMSIHLLVLAENYEDVYNEAVKWGQKYHVFKVDIPKIQKLAKKLDNGAVSFMLDKIKNYPDDIAIVFLGALKDSRAVEPLIKILQEERIDNKRPKIDNERTVGYAIWALGQIGDKRATAPLIEIMNQGKGGQFILDAIGNLGDERAVLPLIERFKKGIIFAAYPLGQLKDPRGLEVLYQAIGTYKESEIDPVIAQASPSLKYYSDWVVARGLTIANTPLALEMLSNIIFDEKRPLGIRVTTLDALGNGLPYGGNQYVVYTAPSPESFNIILKAANDKEPEIRIEALTGLGNFRTKKEEIQPILLKMLENETVNDVRMHVIYALSDIGDENVINDLQGVIEKEKDQRLQMAARLGIKNITERVEKEKAEKEK